MQRNWLDVYPYTNWGGNGTLPVFVEGQEFVPASIDLKEVCACTVMPPPWRLSHSKHHGVAPWLLFSPHLLPP
jgi:hypothetical protein